MFGTPSVIRPSASVSVGVVGPKGSSLTGAQRLPLPTDGYDGDYFVALVAGAVHLYGPKAAGAWSTSYVSLTGPQGAPGPQILSGGGAPTAVIGNNNDYYIDTAASVLYGPKNTGAWPTPGANLIGQTGPTGPANTLSVTSTTLPSGSPATAAITGTAPNQALALGIPAGSVIYPGSGAPASGTGANGDFYVDTTNYVFYGPKASGAWPMPGFSIIGPAGPAGPGTGNVIGPTGSITTGHLAAWGADNTHVTDSGIDPTTLATKTMVLTRGQVVALALGAPF